MGLGFLVPAFLAGLAALAVPIVIHFRHREWERPHRFPSLMFLRRIPIRTARRRRITDWLLLALRAAVVALLVAAFARPFFRRSADAGASESARAVALLLDRSLSMSHRDVWSAALDSARQVIRGLRPGDRVSVIRFDDQVEVAQALSADHAAALAAVTATRTGSRGTRYAAALRAGRQSLSAGPGAENDNGGRGDIVVVTDLQRSGLTGLAGLELPADVTVRVIAVGPRSRANAALLGADVQRVSAPGGRSELLVSARVTAKDLGDRPRKARLSLTVDGRAAGSRETVLPADGVVTASFDRVPLAAGRAAAVIAMEADALPGDDTLRVVVPAEEAVRILLVVPPGHQGDETLFMERALGIGRDPRFAVERRSTLDAGTLRTAGVVVLFDTRPPSADGSAGAALEVWVRSGGGLIVTAGSRINAASPAPLLAGTAQGIIERMNDRGGSFGDVSLEHPVFSAFRAGGVSGLGSARFLRYARLGLSEGSQVLARFDDGAYALLERPHGAGRLLLLGIPLDNLTGDFPLQPAYLPFLRSLAVYAAGHQVAPLWRTTGEAAIVPKVAEPVISTPGGALLRPSCDSGRGGGPCSVALDEAGFYRTYSGRATGDPAEVVAVNPPPPESDLTPADARELLLGVRRGDSAATITSAGIAAVDQEARQSVWRWLLGVIAALLILEAVVANRGWRGTAASVLPPSPERKPT